MTFSPRLANPRLVSSPRLTWRQAGLCGRLVLRISTAGLLFILPQAALADGEIRTSAIVSTSAGWSSNPFAEVGSGRDSAYVQVDVRPVISLVEEHSSLTLSGSFDYEHYFRRYPDSNDYGVGLDYSGSLSSRLTAHAGVHYDSSIIGGFDAINRGIDPTLPLPPPVTIGPDLALVGTRDRRSTVTFSGDTAYTLSARDVVNANAYYTQSRYGGAVTASNYDNYGGGLGYSRRLTEHLQLGLQASASRYVYKGVLGNSQVYSLQATVRDQLSDRWSLSGAVGASRSDQSAGGKQTNLTGNIQLCRLSPRSSLCVFASDAVLPTGYSGTVDTKSVGATYSYKLTEHSGLLLSGQYSRNGQPIDRRFPLAGSLADSYVTLSGEYDRTLSRRVHFIASTHFRKIIGTLNNSPADFGGTLGISVRFGDLR